MAYWHHPDGTPAPPFKGPGVEVVGVDRSPTKLEIRYAYDQLQMTGTTTAIKAQLTEFEKMSNYRREDTSGATSCHCKLINEASSWDEMTCMPYTEPQPPYNCAC